MWVWFGLAIAALIGEVATGTFYLLLVAVGFAAAGGAAALAWGLHAQLLVCGCVALAGLIVLRLAGVLKKREVNAARNANVNLDIGQIVQVTAWPAEGPAQVWYRGANWQAEREPGMPAVTGEHIITAVRGSRLVIAPRADGR